MVVDPDASAMGLYDGARDGQAEPGTTGCRLAWQAGSSCVRAVEALEHLLQRLVRQAGAVVAYPYAYGARATGSLRLLSVSVRIRRPWQPVHCLRSNFYTHPSGVTQGVVEEVAYHLRDPVSIDAGSDPLCDRPQHQICPDLRSEEHTSA